MAVPPYMHPIAVAVQPAERHRGRGKAQAPGLASLSRLRGAGCGIRNGRGDFDHRLQSVADYSIAAQDVASAVEQARGFDGVDPDRVGLWFFSGGGLLVADWLAAPPPWLRCVAMTYPVLTPLQVGTSKPALIPSPRYRTSREPRTRSSTQPASTG